MDVLLNDDTLTNISGVAVVLMGLARVTEPYPGVFELLDCRTVGERHLKMKVQPPGERRRFDAIAFNTPPDFPVGLRARLVYRLDVNEWRGNRAVQLIVEHLEPA